MAFLRDDYGRTLNYVRISVTDRCNFRCTYCMPPNGVECISHSEILRYEEISRLCAAFWNLGVRKFRFTGGEPLVRKGMVPFLRSLKGEFPEMKIALTTNASLLEPYVFELHDMGIHSLNISLDTLDREKFASITRVGNIDTVISGIRSAVSAGISNIKLNTVLIRGFNDTEICNLLEFAGNEKIMLRLIEFMPLEDSVWNKDAFISGSEILKMLPGGDSWEAEKSGRPEDGPAQYYRNAKTGASIGIITAVSNHFCRHCNRLRVSASGNLRTCLFSPTEIALRDYIAKDDIGELENKITESVKSKPKCWNDIRTGKLHMSGIGG